MRAFSHVIRSAPSKNISSCALFRFAGTPNSGTFSQVTTRRSASCRQDTVPPATADAVNHDLRAFEQVWLHDAGIPGRAWFKHLLYAPRYTYAAMSLPGVTEAAEARDWTRATAQVALLLSRVEAAISLTERATARLTVR